MTTSVSKRVYDCLDKIFRNPEQKPEILGINLDIDLLPQHQTARILSAKTTATEVKPGQWIKVDVVAQLYRDGQVTKSIPVQIPDNAHPGDLRIMVSGGTELDTKREEDKKKLTVGKTPEELRLLNIKDANEAASKDLKTIIKDINKLRDNDRIYLSLFASNPQTSPSLPLSVANVMRSAAVKPENLPKEVSIGETSMPLDYEVTGEESVSLKVQ